MLFSKCSKRDTMIVSESLKIQKRIVSDMILDMMDEIETEQEDMKSFLTEQR